jgi:hypothetical protein
MENLFIGMIFVAIITAITFFAGIIMLIFKLGQKKIAIRITIIAAIVFVISLIIGFGACVSSLNLGGMH